MFRISAQRHFFSLLAILTVGMFASTHASLAGSPVYVGNARATLIGMDEIDHRPWNELVSKYVDQNGRVNYRAWHKNQSDVSKLDDYLASLSRAAVTKDPGVTKNDRLAFWINAYNAVTIKGILREYPTSSIRNHTAKLWGYNIWKDLQLYVGRAAYSLDQIEHEILRKMEEPRIHFAIVCASIGCPRLLNEAYVADRVEQQLTTNAVDFFSRRQNFRYDARSRTVYLSSILSWFGEDFGASTAKQLQTISPWLPESVKPLIASAGKLNVRFLDYDWNLNEQTDRR